ncbi:hypothetical protein ACGFMM_34520 [Streptomyces sp. NPDC048604]|uniref:hypothetical protein n=1 Tax=Streptomyces sp. NPDC048604 TaxID=3365578 RepID=UPI003717F5D8
MHLTRARASRPLVVAAALATTLGVATGVSVFNGADSGPGRSTAVANAASESRLDTTAQNKSSESRPSTTARKKSAATTKYDCPFTVERPFVQNGRLYARTTVTCKKRHTIVLTVTLRRPTWLGGSTYIADGKVQLNNWKGTKSLTTSISCNEVSPRTTYTAGARLLDVRFLGYPIEVDDKKSPGGSKGC